MPEGVTKCRSLNDLAVQRGPIKSAGRVHNGFGNWAGLARLRCTPEIDKQYMCQKLIPPVFPLLVGGAESMVDTRTDEDLVARRMNTCISDPLGGEVHMIT